MTDKDEELLADLLLRWEELRDQGQDITAQELCQDHPDLIDQLARRINALTVTSWLDKPIRNEQSLVALSNPTGEPRTLIGRYRLDNLIAEGGFAHVWRGYDIELQRVVAIKVPKPGRLQSADAFMAEARRVARLKHPGIVPVFDVGREGELCFIVSEFVEGGSLGDHLLNSPPSQEQAIRWVAEIADALEYAHLHGVIHRDIKPANILIDHHNRALLADFGIAQSANKAGQQALSIGTLRYMSPEQLEGRAVDPSSDVFSLGILLHEALTGTLPYSSNEPNVLRKEIVAGVKNPLSQNMPASLRNICKKALMHDPHQRHTSAAQFAADLRRSLTTKSPTFRPWLLAVTILTLIATGCFWLMFRSSPANQIPGNVEFQDIERDARNPELPSQTPKLIVNVEQEPFDPNSPELAAEDSGHAIEVDPTGAFAFDRRGSHSLNSGRFKESLADFDKAIELDPKKAEFYQHRALAYLSLRQFDSSIADMKQALELNPPNRQEFEASLATIYSNRAADRSNAKMFADAAADMTLAINLYPQGRKFHHQRGSCFFNNKEYEKAAEDFTEAIRQEPTEGAHYLNRGYCLQLIGKVKDATSDFEMAKTFGAIP